MGIAMRRDQRHKQQHNFGTDKKFESHSYLIRVPTGRGAPRKLWRVRFRCFRICVVLVCFVEEIYVVYCGEGFE
ncbi:hypothetical protein KC19_VG015500 [Ceratodon purpureus]|uniref:Uncharacterized protein n=1 Tax=Ceratodon purpureus TaxID=3225 RepID=A0A8T0HLA7_CERPU|nr:hypothetical protein KC19_VG015500 [Ceratodon purpureus]